MDILEQGVRSPERVLDIQVLHQPSDDGIWDVATVIHCAETTFCCEALHLNVIWIFVGCQAKHRNTIPTTNSEPRRTNCICGNQLKGASIVVVVAVALHTIGVRPHHARVVALIEAVLRDLAL